MDSPPQTPTLSQQQQQETSFSLSPPPPPSSSSSFSLESLNPSIFITIIIIASTIILSFSLCLLLRLLRKKHTNALRVTPHNNNNNNNQTTSINNNTTQNTNTNTNTNANTNTNNSTLLNSLPSFTFSSVTRKNNNTTQNDVVGDCAVCLAKFEEQDRLRLLPLCCHAFHVECIDTWLMNNESCPICRAGVRITESDLFKVFSSVGSENVSSGSFRLELGSISRRQDLGLGSDEVRDPHSYSIGSFDYIVQDDGEVEVSRKDDGDFPATGTVPAVEVEGLAGEVGGAGGRSWLKDYVDRLSASISSRTASFRSSGRFFTGSSRRTEVPSVDDYDLEANRIGEEISEFFRWFSAM